MAKIMKRLVAMAIVLTLTGGMLAGPAYADDQQQAGTPLEVTVDITDDAGNVIGQKVIRTEVEENDSSASYSQETNITSQWETSETENSSSGTQTQGSVTTETAGSVVTEVEGSESSTDKIHSNKNTGVQTYSGSGSGEETAEITDTTTTTTTTQDTLLDSSTLGPSTVQDGELEQGQWSELISTGEGQWTKTGSSDGDFEQIGDLTESSRTDSIDVDTDPLADRDVELNFTAPTGSKPSTDSESIRISIEDALANDIRYTDGQIVNGYVVKLEKDNNGNLIAYSLTKYANETNNSLADAPIVPDKSDEDVQEQAAGGVNTANSTPIDPDTNQPYVECENEPILENGVQVGVKSVKASTDPDTGIVTYTITKERWERRANNSQLPDLTPTDVPADSFTLPSKPAAPAPVTVGGLTTTVTVEDIVVNGNVVGYTTTTRVTDQDGNEVSMDSESIYGTYTSHSSNVERLPEYDKVTTTTVTTVYNALNSQDFTKTNTGTKTVVNTRDVSQELYQLVELKDGLYFLFEGKMYKVKALTGKGETFKHGNVEMSSLKPHSGILALTPSGDGRIDESTDLRNPHYNDGVDVGSSTISNGYDYKYVGYGLESSITADTGSNNGNGTLVHQFKLLDENGNEFFALCADYSTSADRGADYSMENVWDADYYDHATAKKISGIALNGYWGTKSGIGSLDTVISFLKKHSNLSDSLLEGLTPGEALTATQAAIWYYGNSGPSKVLGSTDATGKQYTGSKSGGSWTFQNASENETKRINALYQALINLDSSSIVDNSTELLSTDNFAAETQLVIKERATDHSGKELKDEKGNDLYLADLSFSIDVKKSDLTGNLIVTIVDENNKELYKGQLSTADSNLVGKMLADGSASSSENVYTIENLKLPAGVKFDLNLSGIQNLREGVYLYSAEVYSSSQTFVGIGSGTHEVNLNVQMEFSVTDPSAKIQHTSSSWTEQETDQEFYSKTDDYRKDRLDTSVEELVTVTTDTYGTAVRTDICVEETTQHRQWRYNYFYQLITVNDDDGGVIIEDEDVPLADAPRTGDSSILFAVLSLLSLGGVVVLRKKED